MRATVLVLALAAVACSSSSSASDTTSSGGPSSPTPTPTGMPTLPTAPAAKLDCAGHGCGVKQLALGIIAACALLEDTTVACYGGGIVGTLGRADKPTIDPVPQRVPNLKNVAKVYAGGYSVCALLLDKTVSCWGPDQSAGPYGARPGDFFVVDGLPNVVDLAVSTSHTCALLESGDVYCFGSNYFGELGDGTIDNAKKPVKVTVISGVKKIATGGELSCAIIADGSVSCWGLNDQGQLGQGDSDKLIHPMAIAVPGLGGPVKDIAASSVTGAVCALLEDGTSKCWGEKIPGTPAGGGASLAVGGSHACVLDAAGAISCWGANNKGQLGNGSNAAISTPVMPSGVLGALSMSTGGNTSCTVFTDGSFSCWGDDTRGQLGSGQIGTTRPTPAQKHF